MVLVETINSNVNEGDSLVRMKNPLTHTHTQIYKPIMRDTEDPG